MAAAAESKSAPARGFGSIPKYCTKDDFQLFVRRSIRLSRTDIFKESSIIMSIVDPSTYNEFCKTSFHHAQLVGMVEKLNFLMSLDNQSVPETFLYFVYANKDISTLNDHWGSRFMKDENQITSLDILNYLLATKTHKIYHIVDPTKANGAWGGVVGFGIMEK